MQETMQSRPMSAGYEDEINLMDLVKVLIRRKWIITAVFAVCLLGAVAVALLKPPVYSYTTSLEIGSVVEEGKYEVVDSSDTLLAKIKESYIPITLAEYAAAHPDDDIYQINARVPKNSDIVVIEAKGTEAQGQVLKTIESDVIARVIQDHARILTLVRKELEVRLEKARHELDSLEDDHKVIEKGLERLEVTRELLQGQVASVKSLVEDAISNRKSARGSASDQSLAMTLLMIDNEINQNTRRLAELEERLFVKLPNAKDDLEKKLADSLRAQANKQAQISQIETELNNIRETRAVIDPAQSLAPVGLGKKLMVVLGAIVGIMLGLFAAFIVEFGSRMRAELAEEKGC